MRGHIKELVEIYSSLEESYKQNSLMAHLSSTEEKKKDCHLEPLYNSIFTVQISSVKMF